MRFAAALLGLALLSGTRTFANPRTCAPHLASTAYVIEVHSPGGTPDLRQIESQLVQYDLRLDRDQAPVPILADRYLLKATRPDGSEKPRPDYQALRTHGVDFTVDGKRWLHAEQGDFAGLSRAQIASFNELIQEYVVFGEEMSLDRALSLLSAVGALYAFGKPTPSGGQPWRAVVYVSESSRERLKRKPGFIRFEEIDFI